MKKNQAVTDYINNAEEHQGQILEALRKIIHSSVGGVTEEIKWGFPVFSKYKNFSYLSLAKKHVTLGFYNFDRIPNAEIELEGTGNTLRHVKIRNMSDIDEAKLLEWLSAVAK